jgi:vanillate O-demethylase ferredoxin subunit
VERRPGLLAVRIAHVRDQAVDIRSFDLIGAPGTSLPPFEPGAHVDVHLAGGIVRQYSLCNGPGEHDRYRIAVKREPDSRGGSRAMHELREGDVLTIGPPRNHFPLKHAEGPSVLVAGGIGITPLLAMALQLAADARLFTLHYFTRSLEHTAFRRELSSAGLGEYVTFNYGSPPEAVQSCLADLFRVRPACGQLYVCGPRPFMDLVVQVASAAAWPASAINLEYFAADDAALAAPVTTFRVRLARRGGEYTIPPDRSIVAVLAEHGIAVETSCEQGVCGTCLARVLEGTPDHRDSVLGDDEKAAGGWIACCVSRSHSPVLVLDL